MDRLARGEHDGVCTSPADIRGDEKPTGLTLVHFGPPLDGHVLHAVASPACSSVRRPLRWFGTPFRTAMSSSPTRRNARHCRRWLGAAPVDQPAWSHLQPTLHRTRVTSL